MKRLILTLALVLLTACGPGPAAPSPAPLQMEAPLPSPELLATPALAQPEATSTGISTETPTPAPFVVQFTEVPTETLLPPLELPTQALNPPALQVWDGLPTYPADSRPDYYFRLRFDPRQWALTTDAYGQPALGHRAIPYCVISPSSARGLYPNYLVEHAIRKLGLISYQIDSVSLDGVRQFVTYSGGDGIIYTAFQVSFQDSSDQCLQDAETAFATLASVPAARATPLPTRSP